MKELNINYAHFHAGLPSQRQYLGINYSTIWAITCAAHVDACGRIMRMRMPAYVLANLPNDCIRFKRWKN